MARQTRKWNPGDAANVFVRVLLSDAGQLLGGLSESEWTRTMAHFGGRCAYTGAELDLRDIERDHAIPMNRAHCGLHLCGNVLPTSKAVNRRKRDAHYRDFVDDAVLLARIEAFRDEVDYDGRVGLLGDLRHYCEAQYDAIDKLCRVNRRYLRSVLPEEHQSTSKDESSGSDSPRQSRTGGKTLPIAFDPAPEAAFKTALLASKRAYITIDYADGSSEVKPWNAGNFTLASHVSGNLRSRPQFRSGTWQALGIEKILVSTRKPSGQNS